MVIRKLLGPIVFGGALVSAFALAAPVTNLNTGETFSSIQDAIDDPDTQNGHVIEVNSNEYDCSNEPGNNPFGGGGKAFIAIWKEVTVRSTGGAENTVIDGTGHNVVVAIFADNVVFQGFTVKGAQMGDYGWATGIEIGEQTGITVQNCIIEYNENHGISIYDSTYCTISDSVIRYTTRVNDSGGHGTIIHGGSSYIIVENNTVSNNDWYGIEIFGSSNNTVSNNTVDNNTEVGIRMAPDDNNNLPAEENIIIGNTVSTTHGWDGSAWAVGIWCYKANKNYIRNNTVTETDDRGIQVRQSEYCEISGNTVSNNGGYGIDIYGSSNNIVSNNYVYNNAELGIKIGRDGEFPAEKNLISGNTVTATHVLEGGDWAVGIYCSEADQNYIRDNTVTSNDVFGIQLWRSNFCEITGNTVSQTGMLPGATWGGIGIELPESNHNYIYNNTVENNDHIGIVLNGASYNVVEANLVDNNGVGLQEGRWGWGINVHSFYDSEGNLKLARGNAIIENTISDTKGDKSGGIVIGSAIETLVSGNVITNNGVYGIDLCNNIDQPVSNNSIVDNTIDTHEYAGIAIWPGNSGNVVENNEISNTRIELESGFVEGIGLLLWGSVSLGPHEDYQIINNYVHDNAFGMFISRAANCVISNNTVEDNAEWGPDGGLGSVLYYDDVTWWYLMTRVTGGGGIFLNGTGNLVEDNVIRRNGFGLEIQGGADDYATYSNIVRNNIITDNNMGTQKVQLEKYEWVEDSGQSERNRVSFSYSHTANLFPLEFASPNQASTQGYWERTQVILLANWEGFGIAATNASSSEMATNIVQNNGQMGCAFLGFDEPDAGLSGQSSMNAIRQHIVSGHSQGVYFWPYAFDNLVERSEIANNLDVGVKAEEADGNVLYCNTIVYNTNHGVENVDADVLDARYNWWGSSEGPGAGGTNDVVGNVLYDPWLTSEGCESTAIFRIERVTGNVLSVGSFFGSDFVSGSADIAEWVPVSEKVEPGDVLEIDPENPGYYRKARGPCSQLVAGVVSTEPGFVLGHSKDTEGKALLALLGIVPVKVTDEGGPIRPGDLLVVSSTPGYAMRWDPDSEGFCMPIGKALEPWEGGTGVIVALLIH